MTRTIRQPFNSSHIPALAVKERAARNGYEPAMKPTLKKNGAGKANWGIANEVYELWEGTRDTGLKVQ
ncbi:hypothetical protein HDU98_004022, partial [Podochytrium sp. JEL0797]